MYHWHAVDYYDTTTIRYDRTLLPHSAYRPNNNNMSLQRYHSTTPVVLISAVYSRRCCSVSFSPWCCSSPFCDAGIPIRLRTVGSLFNLQCVAYKLARRRSLQWFVTFSMPITVHWWHIPRQTPSSSSVGSWMPLPALAWRSAWGRQKSCYNQSTVSHPCRLLSWPVRLLFQQWRSSAVLAACCHRMWTLTTTSAHDWMKPVTFLACFTDAWGRPRDPTWYQSRSLQSSHPDCTPLRVRNMGRISSTCAET